MMTAPIVDGNGSTALRPGEFGRLALQALSGSEGRRKKRKRDTTPDAIGLDLKRDLLRRAAEADPEPEAFEGWLLAQAVVTPAAGPVRAMCAEILDEYRLAARDRSYGRWLWDGAPSDDARDE